MKSAFEIVPYFLKQSRTSADILITPLKLQKLLYYAQAWSLVFREYPLFYENIEAWIHGPVVPCVYHRYKQHSYRPIPKTSGLGRFEPDEFLVLLKVWENYGKMSASELEELTHSEDPWRKARSGLNARDSSNRNISLQDMKQYYSRFVHPTIPLAINPLALQKKQLRRKKTIQNILNGMGSVLELNPTSVSRIRYTPEDFATSSSELESISSYWEKVGRYIGTAINLVEESSATEHERNTTRQPKERN